jgi:hypothetical protein
MNIREVAYPVCVVALLSGVSACGSSSTVTTPNAPSTVRCPVTVATTTSAVPSSGGSGTIAVTTARECVWSATSEVPWITLSGNHEGQGDGTIPYTIAANPDPANRRGTVAVNGQRAEVTQGAAACRYDITPASASLGAGAGEIPVQVSTAAPCRWTSASGASWIVIASGVDGTGEGRVMVSVAPNSGPSRSATATIAGRPFAVSQAAAGAPAPAPDPSPSPTPGPPPSCSIALYPSSQSIAPAAGDGTVNIAVASGCGWTAISDRSWLTIASGNVGFGNGTIHFQVTANGGSARTATIRVNDRNATVTQDSPAPPAPAPAPIPQEVKVEGKVSTLSGACPNLTFVVKDTKVTTSGSTKFKGGACDKLRNGDDVEVRGISQADGSVQATEVERD